MYDLLNVHHEWQLLCDASETSSNASSDASVSNGQYIPELKTSNNQLTNYTVPNDVTPANFAPVNSSFSLWRTTHPDYKYFIGK
eukprot:TRINITY_DN8516_c0_g1_i1.p1 TRINITY_DN8516_c0_g1~~TRINITY_DN8516_c0_g1_i1.p1  ORF type:complete len:84 (-),score=6.80 TRINITY_DN8516_c0_g1_i1:130-381(-)